jgi:hypothetical protein
LTLGTVSLPAGAVTKTVTVRARASGASFIFAVYVGVGSPALVYVEPASASITTYTGATVPISWNQAAIDALTASIQGADVGRIYEIYADLVYATVPTVTPSAPTGTVTTSTSPTMVWAYTAGSDGDVQSRYQIRVFSAAEYGIVGFDPATSPATYDSGEVISAATSRVIGPIPTGTNYRAYIRVAQQINGSPHYSAWAYTAFTMSVTTSDITSVVATPDNTNARHTIVVTWDSGSATWETLELERSDDAGATWTPVRGFTGGAAVSGSTWPANDYESQNSVNALFRSRATYLSGGLPIVGPWTQSSATKWAMAADWLKDPTRPGRNRAVMVQANPVLDRPRPQGVNDVIGRRDPIVVSDIRRTRRGQLVLITLTDDDADDLLDLTDADVLLFQPRPGARIGQMYIAIGAVPEAPVNDLYDQPERLWPISFVEVAKPVDIGVL